MSLQDSNLSLLVPLSLLGLLQQSLQMLHLLLTLVGFLQLLFQFITQFSDLGRCLPQLCLQDSLLLLGCSVKLLGLGLVVIFGLLQPGA